MEQDELMQSPEDQTGELDQTFEISKSPAVAVDHLATVLIILTSFFLLLSVVMTGLQLYNSYGIGNDQKVAVNAKP